MKRFVAEVIAAKLSDEEISGLKQMFKMIDTDNNEYISFEELKDGLSSFGANLEESEIHDLMQAVILVSFLPSHQQEHQKPPKKSILEPIQAILPPPIAATSVFKQATERRYGDEPNISFTLPNPTHIARSLDPENNGSLRASERKVLNASQFEVSC